MLYYGAGGLPWRFSGEKKKKNPPANAGDISLIPFFGKISQRRKWHITPKFLPGKCHGQKGLAGYSPWDHTEIPKTSH